MESNKSFTKVDPDYMKYNLALKEIEGKDSEENELTPKKLHDIIATEFDRELSFRQHQLEEIEEKIFKAQKLLHLVRYVLISSYYNKRNLEYDSTAESLSSLFDAQNRIHPAVKKLLGNNSSFEVLASRGKRKAHSKNNEAVDDSEPVNLKKFKTKEESDNLPDNSGDNGQSSLKRKKIKHRILVGNISKWMPSSENDNTTHKWMVYVRGPKEAPDLSHIIDKVIFYLHPSYKPHDVVEVSQHPFHLSRRGWGEFPLRVQIFFKCTLNKPVSIVHNLKLDKTYTGRQTLGNETIVDVFLHDNNIPIKPEPNILPSSNETIFRGSKILNLSHIKSHTFENRTLIKDEPMDDTFEDRTLIKDEPMDDTFEENANILRNIKSELPSTDTCSEHNYCHDDETAMEEEMDEENSNLNTSILDHNYSLPYSDSDSSPKNVTNREEKVDEQRQEHDNNLIFGLDASYGDVRLSSEEDDATGKPVVRTFTTATGQPIKVLPQSFNKVLLKNGNIVQIRLLKVPQTKQIECDTVTKELLNVEKDKICMEKYKVNFPKKMFKNVGEVLPYLFKRLPLWDESAKNPDFKRTYPYVANSLEEFMSWHEGKRLSSEWSRAKCVKKILCREHFPDVETWNTKSLFMYARSHGYSLPILHSSILFTTPSTELDLLSNCYSNSSQNDPCNNDINSDLNVNITDDNDASSPLKNRQSINISDSSLKHQRTFIKETALDSGILLKEEDIADGVSWNGAERMILEAVKCLAENLIRRARHHAVCKGDNSEIVEIDADEIKIAIEERPEIKSIVEHQRRRLVEDFFS